MVAAGDGAGAGAGTGGVGGRDGASVKPLDASSTCVCAAASWGLSGMGSPSRWPGSARPACVELVVVVGGGEMVVRGGGRMGVVAGVK